MPSLRKLRLLDLLLTVFSHQGTHFIEEQLQFRWQHHGLSGWHRTKTEYSTFYSYPFHLDLPHGQVFSLLLHNNQNNLKNVKKIRRLRIVCDNYPSLEIWQEGGWLKISICPHLGHLDVKSVKEESMFSYKRLVWVLQRITEQIQENLPLFLVRSSMKAPFASRLPQLMIRTHFNFTKPACKP